jgi:tripartite-type tricarboxylate transporter receptor subunit TctC
MIARRQVLQFVAAAPLLALHSQRAFAQAYPARPVRVIVTTGPGGQGDTTARLVAAKLTESLGQSFYIENIPGGGGNIAMAATARAAPDGYTLLAATSNIVTNISLYPKIAYDPYKDFAPISLMCSSPHVLVVHPSIPAQSVKELVALAKASPGKYSYASAAAARPRISPASCSS